MATEFRRSLTVTTTGLDRNSHIVLGHDDAPNTVRGRRYGLTDVQVQVSQVDELGHEVKVLCGDRSKDPGYERSHSFWHHGTPPAWLQTLIDAAVDEFDGMERDGWGPRSREQQPVPTSDVATKEPSNG